MNEGINFRFSFGTIDLDDLIHIVRDFKVSASGHDDIPIKVVKHVINEIAPVILYICNLSLISGDFPNDLKIAKVAPIFKNGDSTDVCNYRPISVLPAFSKIFE